MGCGVVGVTTAYLLAKDGHKVKVVDSQDKPAMGTSFANGAQLSYSHIEPLSSPASLRLMAKALIKPGSFLSINSLDKELIAFLSKLVINSGTKNSHKIAKNLFEIGQSSKKIFNKIIEEEKIKFEYSNKGILHIFRSSNCFENAKKFSRFQNSIGDNTEVLSVVECVEKEPTLIKMVETKELRGGIFHEEDASGNPYLFARELMQICKEKYGVEFSFNDKIKNILTNSKKITGINCQKGVYQADAYIYCMASEGLSLLKGINVETGIYPVIGASVSTKVKKGEIAPRISITDPQNRMVYSRIGDVFRAAGGISIGDKNNNEKMAKFIRGRLKDTFSSYGDVENATDWQGYRPFRADSTPIIGDVKKYGNLYLNTGHGHLGWTMSCGSAEIIRKIFAKNS